MVIWLRSNLLTLVSGTKMIRQINLAISRDFNRIWGKNDKAKPRENFTLREAKNMLHPS